MRDPRIKNGSYVTIPEHTKSLVKLADSLSVCFQTKKSLYLNVSRELQTLPSVY